MDGSAVVEIGKAAHTDVETDSLTVLSNTESLSLNLGAYLEEGAVCAVSDYSGMVNGTPAVSGSTVQFSTGAGDSGTILVSVSSRNYEDYTITVQLNAGDLFTLRFDSSGGSAVTETRTLHAGEYYGTLPTPSRAGYTFQGWYTAKEDGERADETTAMGGADVTLFAKWTAIQYTVTLNLDGGSLDSGAEDWTVSGNVASRTFQIDTPDFRLPRLLRADGTLFVGWYETDGSASLDVTIPQGTAADLAYFARWLNEESRGRRAIYSG